MAKLDPDDSRPPYQQVTDNLRTAIDAGTYPPGAKLPSYDALAEEFSVSLGVVKRAIGQLRDDGLVISRQGQGAYVRSERSAPDAALPTLAELHAELVRLGQRLDAVEGRLAERD